jgi:hypothetical protein
MWNDKVSEASGLAKRTLGELQFEAGLVGLPPSKARDMRNPMFSFACNRVQQR